MAAKAKIILPVRIRKLRTNYELIYDYSPILTTYIKTLPREHRSVRVDNIKTLDGIDKDEWVRIIREIQIGNVISFLVDNSISFVFENLLPEEVNNLRAEYLDRQKRIVEIIKAKEEGLNFEDINFDFMKIQPYDYQKQAVKFFELNNGCAILGDQPGVGKSLPPITYAAKNKLKTLIICPASIKLNWRKEILKFSNEKAFVYKYIPSKKSGNINFKKEESLFHVINYESIQSYIKLEYKHKCNGNVITPGKGNQKCGVEIIDLIKKYKKCPHCQSSNSFKTKINGIVYIQDKDNSIIDPSDYDMIVIDEFHRIKSTKTDWTQIIKLAFRDSIEKKILISGTAIKSRPMEFFSGLNFMEPDIWNNSHDFGTKYCAGYETNFGWNHDGASNLEELFTRISPTFLRRLKKDVLSQLPPKTFTEIEIELTPVERKEYDAILKEVKKVINSEGLEEDKEMTYLEKIHKLKQFTGQVKLNRLISDGIVTDIASNGDKLVIMSDYQSIAETLHNTYPDISVLHTGSMNLDNKQASVDRFQEEKKISLFSGMIGASGVGITLTEASKLIFLGLAWTPGDMMQAEDRIHRATTTHNNIQIITYICIDTIDEIIRDLLNQKESVVYKILDGKAMNKNSTSSDSSIMKELINNLKSH